MTGVEMMSLLEELYPITRSITGDGVRETLAILSRHVPIEVHEVPSGSPALDWTVQATFPFVPEPSSALLIACSLAGLMASGRRAE